MNFFYTRLLLSLVQACLLYVCTCSIQDEYNAALPKNYHLHDHCLLSIISGTGNILRVQRLRYMQLYAKRQKPRRKSMGVDHGGTGGTRPPRIWSRGTIMQIVPRRFCHISTKMSVLWPSKYAKIRFRPGLRPGPRWGSSLRSPDPLVG